MLRANLEFVNLDRGARSILVTSALEQEGKSTTVANLAVALARAGQKVALVDLDLRRPAIAKFFGIPDSASGRDERRRRIVDAGAGARRGGSHARRGDTTRLARTATAQAPPAAGGVLKVLPSGPVPRDPGEFVSSKRLTAALEQLAAVVRLRPHRHASAALGRRRDGSERPRRRDDHGRSPERAPAAEPRRACAGARDLPDDQARRRRHRAPRRSRGTATAGYRVPPHRGGELPGRPSSRDLGASSRRDRCGELRASERRRRGPCSTRTDSGSRAAR